MTLSLPRLPGVLPHVECLAFSLQKAALGGLDQDPGGAPQPPPQVRAMWDSGISGEAK